MWKDPIVAEIRQHREAYAARFNYDLDAICRDLQEKEKTSGRKLVSRSPRPAREIAKPAAKKPA